MKTNHITSTKLQPNLQQARPQINQRDHQLRQINTPLKPQIMAPVTPMSHPKSARSARANVSDIALLTRQAWIIGKSYGASFFKPREPEGRSPSLQADYDQFLKDLGAYHKHRVVGLENLPQKGPFILVFQHTFSTYHLLLLDQVLRQEKNLEIEPIVASQALYTPMLGYGIRKLLGGQKACHKNAENILDGGGVLAVSPGGIKAFLRPETEKYQPDLMNHKGFIRLAMKKGVPIVCVACPGGDDVIVNRGGRLTSWLFEHLRIPFPIFEGNRGYMLPFPKSKELIHAISKPIDIPKKATPTKEAIDRAYAIVERSMNRAIIDAQTEFIEPSPL